jgi:phosphoglycolate phosphatase-like HAD superfamily hydrolase
MIKLIIFDFDDTITDNKNLDFESFKISCKKFNIKNPLSLKKLVNLRQKSYTAKEILKFIKTFTQKSFPTKNFLEYRTNFLLSDISNTYLQIKLDTKLVLKTLQKNKTIIFLFTVRKDKQLVINFLKKNNIEHCFSNIYCSSDLTEKIDNNNSDNRILIKSSLLKKIIKKNKLNHKEILFVGNSSEDRIASSFHKINFLKFNNDYLPKENYNYQYSTNNMKNLNKIVKELIVKND